jgi:hypothetical protein
LTRPESVPSGVSAPTSGKTCALNVPDAEKLDAAYDGGKRALMSDPAEMVMDELQLRMCAAENSVTGAASRRAFKIKPAIGGYCLRY